MKSRMESMDREEQVHRKWGKRGKLLILCSVILFWVLLLGIHRVFVGIGLDETQLISDRTLERAVEKLEIYKNYKSNGITLKDEFGGMLTLDGGVVVVLEKGETIAASTEDALNITGEQWQQICAEGTFVKDRLRKVRYRGERWYLGEGKYEDQIIYALFPANQVYRSYYVIALAVMVVYMTFCLSVFAMYTHNERKSYKRFRKYYQTIAAINSIYMADLLVYLKDGRFEWVKIPEKLKKGLKQTDHVEDVILQFADHYIQPDYRESFLEFMDIHTVEERLKDAKSITYTYEDISGQWQTIRIIPQQRGENGKLEAVLYLVRNVTSEIKKEKDYQKQLKLAGDAKTNFLRRMSHDIRTPINGIRGMVEIAQRNPDDAKWQEECREKVMAASGYLLDLVNNVLDMSKLESGEVKLENTAFNLKELLDRLNEIIGAQCRENGITYKVIREEIVHENLIGSPVHFQQVLMNIVSNSVKYNRENGTVTVRCRELPGNGEQAEFEFICEDTGIGMSKEFQKRIFEPFSQENENARTKYMGTGLGMAIARELIELQDGTISLESEQGKGSRFTVHIGFMIDHKASERKTLAEQAERENGCDEIKGVKILLAEDNELNMEVAEYLLKEQGAILTKAWNGKEAVELFKQSKPGEFDVILMDIMMPVMNGLEAARQIRSLNRPDAAVIPIFAMTANAFQDDVDRSLNAGMNAHITKPLDMKKLTRLIADLAGKNTKETEKKIQKKL